MPGRAGAVAASSLDPDQADGPDNIKRIGFTVPAPVLAVGAIHLHHPDAGSRGSSGAGLADEVVEAGDELAVPVGFADPAAGFGVLSELRSVGFLGGEYGQVARVGAEVGAVLADVGIGAGAPGGSAQAEASGQPGFDRRGIFPRGAAGDVGEGEAGAACGQGPEPLLGEGERARSYSARTVVSNSLP